ncbi:MAG: T9SS type A sorting domain-containing protein [Chitinophagaceae bacterium]
MAVDPTGVTVAWGDLRGSATNADIYAQRVNYNGVIQWTANGVVVCSATGNQTNVRAVRSNGGTILVWGDNRVSTSNRDIYAQKVSDTDGSTMWPTTNGVAICTANGNQPNSVTSGFVVFSDENNGAYMVWDDARNGSSSLDVRAQLINGSGDIQWAENGAAIAIGTGNQNQPTAIATTNGIIAAWRDARTATGAEIYASRSNASGTLLPVQFVRVLASLQNGIGMVQWQVANETNVARYEIEKSSNGTQFERIEIVAAKQANNYQLADRKLLLGKNYYRIKAVDNDGKTTYSSIALLEQNIVATLTVNAIPNPVHSELKIQATNLAAGNYSLRIIQANGSVMKEQRFSSTNALTSVTVPMVSFATGTYTIVITNAKGENLYSTQIQKL